MDFLLLGIILDWLYGYIKYCKRLEKLLSRSNIDTVNDSYQTLDDRQMSNHNSM